MATADTLLVACLVSIVGGAGNGVQWISVVTALQEATPADYQARIVGLLESLGAAMPGVGYLLGGALVALGSPRTAYAVAGAGVLAARPRRRSCSGRGSTGRPQLRPRFAHDRTGRPAAAGLARARAHVRRPARPPLSGNAPERLNLT